MTAMTSNEVIVVQICSSCPFVKNVLQIYKTNVIVLFFVLLLFQFRIKRLNGSWWTFMEISDKLLLQKHNVDLLPKREITAFQNMHAQIWYSYKAFIFQKQNKIKTLKKKNDYRLKFVFSFLFYEKDLNIKMACSLKEWKRINNSFDQKLYDIQNIINLIS